MDPKTKNDETPTPAAIVGNFAETVIEALTAGTCAETLRDLSLQSRLMFQAHQSTISYSPGGNFHAATHASSFSEKYRKYETYDVIPAVEGIRELVVEQRQSVRLTQDELLSDPQWKTFRDLRDDRDLAHPPIRGWLAVPIVSRDGDFVGMLQASDRIEGDFDEMDVQVFERLARMISPTFELQYVNQELQRKTQELEFAYAAHGETESEKSFIVRETGDELSGIDSLDDAMDLWARQARSIVGAHQSAVSYVPRGDFAEGKHAISMSEKYDKYKTYSRVESRSRPFATTDLNDVFDDAVAILHSSIQDSSGKVTRGELPTVVADRSQLFQLLQNLIGNGLKYYGHEPPQVYVSAEQNAGEWTVAVRDNGIGIDAKHHERIFEIFRRLHSQDKYPGTGIGLAICRRIVRRHNGRIWLESEVDKGSTFYFTIPKTASEQS